MFTEFLFMEIVAGIYTSTHTFEAKCLDFPLDLTEVLQEESILQNLQIADDSTYCSNCRS